jgi:Uma2 family endonuclease
MASMVAERVVPYGKKSTIKYANRKPMTYAQFQKRYLNKDDRFKYEWVKGFTIISPHTMERYQFFIMYNIRNFFKSLEKTNQVTGFLESEFNLFFAEDINRKPDIFYFTEEQAVKATMGENPIPEFVIVVVSNTDPLNYMIDKMDDYRNAGVKVVWHIFTIKNEVHVYAGENLMSMTVCKGDMVCSAAPVLPQFALSVNDIFKMPQLKTTQQSAP